MALIFLLSYGAFLLSMIRLVYIYWVINPSVHILQALTEYRPELRDDPIINTHLAKLYDNLLEQNLIRVIEPFSRVQVRTCKFKNYCPVAFSFPALTFLPFLGFHRTQKF